MRLELRENWPEMSANLICESVEERHALANILRLGIETLKDSEEYERVDQISKNTSRSLDIVCETLKRT